jgi:hypothetical protein
MLHPGQSRREGRLLGQARRPAHLVAIGGQLARRRGPLGRAALAEQLLRDYQMLGEAVRLVLLDREARGALVEEGARPELDGDRREQDQQDPPEQRQRMALEQLQDRVTSARKI